MQWWRTAQNWMSKANNVVSRTKGTIIIPFLSFMIVCSARFFFGLWYRQKTRQVIWSFSGFSRFCTAPYVSFETRLFFLWKFETCFFNSFFCFSSISSSHARSAAQLYNSNQVGREEVETSWIGSFNASSGNAQRRRHGSSCDHTTHVTENENESGLAYPFDQEVLCKHYAIWLGSQKWWM